MEMNSGITNEEKTKRKDRAGQREEGSKSGFTSRDAARPVTTAPAALHAVAAAAAAAAEPQRRT
ncbi:unnamed protein product [Ceratitis capitata]|uniref:(Mediterranean fruit fly) hypothetical protein n=1 Tax=Ceratitis capitata TaxID=7213 RepID=A0A811VG47_CERCA|nr:unnamed protein product [Ceratitis capitata]